MNTWSGSSTEAVNEASDPCISVRYNLSTLPTDLITSCAPCPFAPEACAVTIPTISPTLYPSPLLLIDKVETAPFASTAVIFNFNPVPWVEIG